MTSETGVNSDETGGPLSASARRRLRVLSVIPGEPEGSVMIFARRQSASISALGLTVRDFHLADRTSPGRWWQELRRLRQEVCAFDPDLVHAHYGTVTALSAALTKGRRPLVITFRGSDLNPTAAVSGFRSVAGRVISQFSALSAAAVICVCDDLRRSLWWRPRPVHVIPTGVDLALFQPRDKSAARRELGLPLESPVVVFNCGFDPWAKRLELAEATIQHVRRSLPETACVVMRGDWQPASVPALLAAADCLLVTSRQEGSPNIVKEAIACALPVVSVDVGDVRELVNGLRNCHVCDDTAEALGAAVESVLRSGVRSDGRQRMERISTQRVAERIAAVYEEACAGASGRRARRH